MPGQASEVAELRAAQRLCMQTLDAGCCYGIASARQRGLKESRRGMRGAENLLVSL